MRTKIFYLIFYICFAVVYSFAPAAKGQNRPSTLPFDSLLHKTFAENRVNLSKLWDLTVREKNMKEGKMLIDSLHRFATEHKDIELVLEAEFIDQVLCLYKEHPDYEQIIKDLLALSTRAEKQNVRTMQCRALYWAGDIAYEYLNDYEQAMFYYSKMYRLTRTLILEEFPDKADELLHYANKLYFFKDYKRALGLFQEVIGWPVNFASSNPISSAFNTLGLYYQSIKQWDSSDYYFNQVLNFKATPRYYEWEGIASGNLGKNAFMQSDYDKAIPLLIFGFERLTSTDDRQFSAGLCFYLCNIYAYRNNIVATKQWLSKADSLLENNIPSKYLYLNYAVKSKIYSLEKQPQKANAYLDSALTAYEKYGSEFNSLVLLKMEQTERAQEQQQLEIEKKRGKTQQIYLIGTIAALTIISGLLFLYFLLYRQKKAAYENLVRRIVEWAYTTYFLPFSKPDLLSGIIPVLEEDIEEFTEYEELRSEDSESNGLAPENSKILLESIYTLFDTEKLYQDTNLSLQVLAKKLNVSQRTLSKAINYITGMNFKTFVNEYRIKEAVKLLSNPVNEKFTLDAIAFEIGFNDRITFYRSFKKVTGLSPSEFKSEIFKQNRTTE